MKTRMKWLLLAMAAVGAADAAYAEAATDPLFQLGVNRRAVEHSGADATWLFKRPILTLQDPPYVLYRSEEMARLAPGNSFPARIDIAGELNEPVRFQVRWEEFLQDTYRSVHGEVSSTAPEAGKLGTFRFTMNTAGSELTGCVQLQDRDYCFIGKHGVGWFH